MTVDRPKLEHANIVVTDIAPTLAFLQTAFPAWRVRGEGNGDWYGKPRRWLHFGDDDVYVTLNDNGEGAQREILATIDAMGADVVHVKAADVEREKVSDIIGESTGLSRSDVAAVVAALPEDE